MQSELANHGSIRVVFFDAAGTLIKPARRVGESYAAIAAKYGKTVAASDLFDRFRICFDAAPRLAFANAAPDEVHGLERGWWKKVVAQVFEPFGQFDNFDDYFDELFGYFAKPTAWKLFPDVLDTLSALKQRGLALAVISNFDSRLTGILDGLGAGTWFEHVLVSSRIGYAKPERQIFELALAKFALAPEQALHIGDSETNDLEGAKNAGIRALLIDRDPSPGGSVNERISSLRQILDRLD